MRELNRRKKRFDTLRVVGIILMILGGVIMYALIGNETSSSDDVNNLFLVGVIPGGLLFLYAKSQVKKISIEFKNTYVKKEIEKRIENSHFDPNSGISSSEVGDSNLVILHQRYNTEDLLSGSIHDVKFKCADIHIQQRRRSNKRTYYVTTFKGRFYEFDFPKQFNSNVFLLQPGQYRPFSGFEKVKLESIDFNSEFKIYTNNEHDTFYLLTPQLMERLLVLDKKYRDKIGFSFLYSKLYIAIDSRQDAFDVMHFGDITNEHIENAVQEIENIIEFVEFLRLDNTLFKKKE